MQIIKLLFYKIKTKMTYSIRARVHFENILHPYFVLLSFQKARRGKQLEIRGDNIL